mgnify:CR=1 FL=1
MKANNCFGKDLYGFRNDINELASIFFKESKPKRRKLKWPNLFSNKKQIITNSI